MAAFVAVLLCSGIIGVQKVSYVTLPFIGEYIFGAGVLFFPISAAALAIFLGHALRLCRTGRINWRGTKFTVGDQGLPQRAASSD